MFRVSLHEQALNSSLRHENHLVRGPSRKGLGFRVVHQGSLSKAFGCHGVFIANCKVVYTTEALKWGPC